MKNIKVTLVSLLLSLYLINHLDATWFTTGVHSTYEATVSEIPSLGSTVGKDIKPGGPTSSSSFPRGNVDPNGDPLRPPVPTDGFEHRPTPSFPNDGNGVGKHGAKPSPNNPPKLGHWPCVSVDARTSEACKQACKTACTDAADAAVHEAVDPTNSCYAKVISSGIQGVCTSACVSPRDGFNAAKKEGIKAAKKCIKEAADKANANAPAAAEAYPPPADAYPPYADAPAPGPY